ncbi:polysaccharide deacetylase family protein [Candidatus Peregrinibacteria bacterium]|nr:polysaccharide deacetylase family protein [Candidatus Peregrinibacteria bacterium]
MFFCAVFFLVFIFIPFASAESVPETFIPNEIGRIPVMEYHDVAVKENPFVRSYDNFRRDLEFFYNNDYTLITVQDFIDQNFDVPAGKKPLIFTFDDSRQSQFNVKDDGTIDQESVIGIMDSFFQSHPDFGRSAIFYMLQYPFGQSQYFTQKLQYLLKTGREMGNHTLDHDSLGKMTPEQIQQNLAGLQGKIQGLADMSFPMNSLAYPYGAVPKGDNFIFVKKGESGGIQYSITTGFLVGADPTYPPYGVKFDAFLIPRIQADDTEFQRWFARVPGSTNRVEEQFRPFISDGNKETISVLENDLPKLDQKRLRSGLTIVKSVSLESVSSRSIIAGWEKNAVMSRIDAFLKGGDSDSDNTISKEPANSNAPANSEEPAVDTTKSGGSDAENLSQSNSGTSDGQKLDAGNELDGSDNVLIFGWTQTVLDASWEVKKMFSFFQPLEDAFSQFFIEHSRR